MLFLVQFFRAVPPMPSLLRVTLAVTVPMAGLAIWLDPARTPRAMAPLLLLQLFAAASGFAGSARRGHYDLLLVRGDSRLRIALVHWAMSMTPGVAGWLALAVVEAIARGAPGAALASGTVVAVWLVSTIPWALTVALPRFAGAIGWLVLLALLGIVAPLSSLPPVLEAMLFPVTLVGRDLTGPQAPLAFAGIGVGFVAVGLACAWIHRMNVPLEAAQ